MNMSAEAGDRREFERVPLRVRAMVKNGAESEWKPFPVYNVSGKGLAIRGDLPEECDTVVEVQTDRIGGGAARIVRKEGGITALELLDNDEAQLRAKRVDWHAKERHDQRSHQRARPVAKTSKRLLAPVVWPDGRTVNAAVLDISAGGIKLAAMSAAPGEELHVGGVAGRVVRAGEDSVGIAFDEEVGARGLQLIGAR